MAYDTQLADRIREYLVGFPALDITEKEMFSGVCFMVDGKMCVCVSRDNMMCRVDPALEEPLAELPGCSQMVMKGRVMKNYWLIEPDALKTRQAFEYWVNLCLEYNPKTKAAKPKKR